MKRAIAIVVGVLFLSSFAYLAYSQRQLGRVTVMFAGNVPVQVEVARTVPTLRRGLSGRESLADDTGMLFVFPSPGKQAMWMKEMNFAIDIVWLRNGVIVDIAPNVPPAAPGDEYPPAYEPRLPADMVVELPAGFTVEKGLKIGDAATVSGS